MSFIVAVALLAVGLIMVGSLISDRIRIADEENHHIERAAVALSRNIGARLEGVRRVLTNLRTGITLPMPDSERVALSQRLADISDAMINMRTLFVVDAHGTVIAANRPEMIGSVHRSRPYVSIPAAAPNPDILYVSPPLLNDLGIATINLTMTLHDAGGGFAGVITGALEPTDFFALLEAVRSDASESVSLLHHDGQRFLTVPAIALPPDVPPPGASGHFRDHADSARSLTRFAGNSEFLAEPAIVVLSTVRPPGAQMDAPLYVAMAHPLDELYLPWWRDTLIHGSLYLALVAVSAVSFLAYLRRHRESERQQARTMASLALSEARFRGVFDALDSCVAIYSAVDDGDDFVFDDINRTVETLEGVRRDALIGERVTKVFPAVREFGLLAALQRVWREGRPESLPVRFYRDERIAGWRENYLFRLSSGHVVVVYEDVSGRKEAEQALIDARRHAEAANEAKSRFLANMSHEIRTPMNAVLGLMQLLQRTPLNALQADYVGKARSAAGTLLGLLNDILDLSRIEAGHLALDSRRFVLEVLLRDLAVVLSAAVERKPVEILFDIDPAVPPVLIGDAQRIKQVLLNLAGNAIKFTERGEVVIGIRALTVDDTHAEVDFQVRDTGIGIRSEHQAHIFEAFMQAETSTTRRFGGTGLGLAISQQLVALMGGSIRLDSTPDRGSTFAFTLPLARNADSRNAEADARPARAQTALRVLIVDDNETAREVLEGMARSLGWQPHGVASGHAALACLSRTADGNAPYDAVLLDWLMPELDGWQTARTIRSRLPRARIPLIAMVTAHGREQLAEPSRDSSPPFDGFLAKPVTPQMLCDAVADATSTRAPDDPISARTPTDTRLNGLRGLVVEDNPLNQELICELLRQEGAVVSVAGNGCDGLATLRGDTGGFDFVLMDVQMPRMDGLEATRALRADARFHDLPVIAMTANALATDRDACLEAGMNDHIGKPFDMEAVIHTIRRHVTRHRADNMAAQRLASLARAHAANVPPDPDAPLPEADGFDFSNALTRMGGRRALYARALRGYLDNYCGDQPLGIAEALQRQDAAAAQRIAHTLKGLSRTIGAENIGDRAAALESMLRRQPDDPLLATALAELENALHQAADVLEPLVKQLTPPDGSEAASPANMVSS